MDFSDQENLQEIIKEIQMFKVYSTNIVALGYNESRKILRVIFKGNSSYLYFNVEPEVWENLKNSESKGRTLSESIIKQKDKYKYIKI
jgi:hypothetical protein